MSSTHSAKKPHSHMGKVIVATQVITSGFEPRRARNIIILLAGSTAVMMTGFGIIFPIFARRFSELGSGVETLGLMTMAYAITSIVASPFLGTLADRFGRRPIILVSLAAYVAANIGFLLADSTAMIIAVRALQGALTAGLVPASMGIVADIAPEDQRARWVGVVMGGYSMGFVFGPALGGVLYDGWGFAAPFAVSAVMAFIAFLAAHIMVPETRPREMRRRDELRQRRAAAMAPTQALSFWTTLPRPLSMFAVLLFISFITLFAWTFVEPQLMFYIYDELGWTTAQFGVAAGGYGIAAVFGQTVLGQLSDTFGRKPILIVGILLFSAQFAGMMIATSFPTILFAFVIAGLGEALWLTALGAFYLDITPEQHRSRVMGIKGSASSLGSIVGPALVVVVTGFLAPQGVFATSLVLLVLSALLVLIVLREPSRALKKSPIRRGRSPASERWPPKPPCAASFLARQRLGNCGERVVDAIAPLLCTTA